MTLRDAVASPKDYRWSVRVTAIEPTQMRKAVKALPDVSSDAPKGLDVPLLQKRINALVAGNNLGRASNAELRQCPYGFFDGPNPFVDDVAVRTALLAELAAREQKSAVRILAYQYIEHFNPSRTGFAVVGDWLDQQVRQWSWTWHDRAKKHDLFKVDLAPINLANYLLGGSQPITDLLEEMGLSDTALTGGLGAAAFASACSLVSYSSRSQAPSRQVRLMQWARRGDRFGYESAFPAYLSALIKPWHSIEPEASHKSAILAEIESIAGHPRVKRETSKWKRAEAAANEDVQVLLRWLTRAAVYQFFDIIDEVLSADEMYMWAFRRSFWTSYLEQGYISEAWVAFGTNGAAMARRVARASGGSDALAFAGLTGRSSNHAALIMKIGDLTIAEWSHSGKYNIWRPGVSGAPQLYKRHYDAYELIDAPLDGSHHGSDGYSWQNKVANYIQMDTGFRTFQSSWRPRSGGR